MDEEVRESAADDDLVRDRTIDIEHGPESTLRLGISAESAYHRVSPGCPKGFTQQCGISYRT
jgi:hypothetical protein